MRCAHPVQASRVKSWDARELCRCAPFSHVYIRRDRVVPESLARRYVIRSGRVAVSSNQDSTSVAIGPARNYLNAALSLLVALGAFVLSWQIRAVPVIPLFVMVFAVLCGINFLWLLWGRWRVDVTDSTLSVSWSLGGLSGRHTYERMYVSPFEVLVFRPRGRLVMRFIVFYENGERHLATPRLEVRELELLTQGPFKALMKAPDDKSLAAGHGEGRR